jgi:hypothetical protein
MKWILFLGLANLSGLALADWEAVDDNYLAVVYIDPDKVRASSVFPQAWHLIDLRNRSKTGAMSRLVLIEYDCHDQRRRNLAFASKAEPMGEGKTLFTSAVSTTWKAVAGDTVEHKVLLMLCGHNAGKGAKAGKAGKAGEVAPAAPAKSESHGEAKH